jgi:hypothetical protein
VKPSLTAKWFLLLALVSLVLGVWSYMNRWTGPVVTCIWLTGLSIAGSLMTWRDE